MQNVGSNSNNSAGANTRPSGGQARVIEEWSAWSLLGLACLGLT